MPVITLLLPSAESALMEAVSPGLPTASPATIDDNSASPIVTVSVIKITADVKKPADHQLSAEV